MCCQRCLLKELCDLLQVLDTSAVDLPVFKSGELLVRPQSKITNVKLEFDSAVAPNGTQLTANFFNVRVIVCCDDSDTSPGNKTL